MQAIFEFEGITFFALVTYDESSLTAHGPRILYTGGRLYDTVRRAWLSDRLDVPCSRALDDFRFEHGTPLTIVPPGISLSWEE